MLARWVEAGLDPAAFWENTPAQFIVVIEACERRLAQEIQRQQRLVYAQACLSAFAFHRPTRMPDFDEFFLGCRRRQSGEEIKQVLDRFAALQSATAKRKKSVP